jgi:hypothetical protein
MHNAQWAMPNAPMPNAQWFSHPCWALTIEHCALNDAIEHLRFLKYALKLMVAMLHHAHHLHHHHHGGPAGLRARAD